MKSDNVDSAAKVVQGLPPSAAEIDWPARNEETALVGTCKKSIKFTSGDAADICALLKPDLLEEMDACTKFVYGLRKVVCPSSFAKHTAEYRKTTLFAMMQKTTILAVEFMFLDQEDTKAAKEVVKAMAAEACSSADKIKRLESELIALKGFNIARQEIVDLKTTLDAI